MKGKEILTSLESARYCHVSHKTLNNWVDSGKIRAYRTVGGHRRIKLSDLEKFLREYKMHIHEDYEDETRKRVLIVDDELLVRQTIAESLREENEELVIETAADGFEAGMKVVVFRPNLVILDIKMPGLDGFQVCRQIKENAATKNAKIMVLTGYPEEGNLEKMYKSGADRCFEKPMPIVDLKKEALDLLRSQTILNRV